MKKIYILLAIALMAISCGSPVQKPQQAEPVCGGYTDQRELSANEMEFFQQLVSERDTVFSPLSVSTQVVAGLNYKFWCRFEGKSNDASGHCWVTVYKDLQGGARITSITPEE